MQRLVYKNPNGVEIDLTSGNYGVIKWDGFSAVDLEIQSQQVPFQDGSVYLDSLLGERDLSVTVAVNDNNDLEKRYELEREMIIALNPKLGEGELIYTNDFLSKKINCVPHLPQFDTKNMNNSGTRKAKVDFTASNPYWEDVEETKISFTCDDIIQINNDGDVETPVKMIINANNLKNPKIQNGMQKISLEGTFSGPIEINTAVGKKSVVIDELFPKWIQNFQQNTYRNRIAENDSQFIISPLWTTDGNNYDLENSIPDVVCWSSLGFFLGYDGFVKKSYDGVKWEDTGVSLNIGEVSLLRWTGSYFIIAGEGEGKAYKSTDGLSWTDISVPAFSGETYVDFVQAGNWGYLFTGSGKFQYSNNAWQSSITGSLSIIDNYLFSVLYINNTYFFQTRGGMFTGLYFDSLQFVPISNTHGNLKDGICYNTLTGYTVATSGEALLIYNGYKWYWLDIPMSLDHIYYSEYLNKYVGVSQNNIYVFDIINNDINIINNIPTVTIPCIAEGNGIVIGGGLKLRKLVDDEFVEINYPVADYVGKIIYAQNKFLAVSRQNVYISSDGDNWESYVLGFDMGATYNLGFFEKENLFILGGGGKLYTSNNGISWVENTGISGTSYSFVDCGDYMLANIGYYLYRSDDGLSWSSLFEIDYGYPHNGEIIHDKKNDVDYIDSPTLKISTNHGTTWDDVPTKNITIINPTWNDKLGCWIGFNGYSYDLFNTISWNKYLGNLVLNTYYAKTLKQSFIFYTPIYRVELKNKENGINKLTSDLSWNLTLGKNTISVLRKSGNANIELSYKQKYLGV